MLEALKAEINAKIFTIDILGSRAFAYLDKKKISLSDLARALLNYEKDPKEAAYNACQTFEHFIYKFAEDQDIDTSKFDGIIQLGDELKGKNCILKNHLHLVHGIGGLRIITHHKPDKETGRPWIITPIGSLIAILFTASLIKSIYLFREEGKQEF